MSCYVDLIFKIGSAGFSNPSAKKHGNQWCHLTADTIEELHQMAEGIGLKKTYFQNKSVPHYDLIPSKRRLALKHGAIEIADPKKFYEIGRKLRKILDDSQKKQEGA
ncbi:MAG: DUF4031 domain-containing protein [Nostoc sp.]|uniref:DUF4031 domain-containing protein n=1 Tax=Nostoc sp. TaxID=1180 RepID=UPI002FF26D63